MTPSSRRPRSGLLAVGFVLLGTAPLRGQAPEPAVRLIPPLSLPVARPATPRSSRPAMEPPVLTLTLSEGTSATGGTAPAVEAVPLPEARIDELLLRLPAGPSADVDAPGPGDIGDAQATPGGADATISTEPLRVLSVTPSGPTEVAPYVTVVFSRPMVPLGTDGEPTDGLVPARLDPQVPGTWRWLDVRTLRFEPTLGRMPGATEFTVRVGEAIAALDGVRMAAEHTARFRTQGPRVLGGYPSRDLPGNRGLADLTPTILLTFDQAVDPDAVLAISRLEADDRSWPMRAVEPTELDDAMAAVVREAGDDRWAAFRPIDPLPPGSAARLRLSEELPSLEGPLPAGRAQVLSFDVRRRFEVVGSPCGRPQAPCFPERWWIDFSTPLASDQSVADLVRIHPSVEDLSVQAVGSRLWIGGDVQPYAKYTLELDAELRDSFGQRLGATTRIDAHFGGAVPFVQIPGAPFLVLDPSSGRTIEVASRALAAVDFELYEVEPDDWTAFRVGAPRSYDPRRPSWPPDGREPVARWTVAPEDAGRGYTRMSVDLGPALGERRHHAVLIARGVRPERPRPAQGLYRGYPTEAAVWIQSTSFTLGGAWNPEELVGWAVSTETGEPVPSVELELHQSGGRATTDDDGLARLPLTTGDSLLLGRQGSEVAMLPALMARVRSGRWTGDPAYPAPVWFTLTDRGLYKPGETVEAHGWLREPRGDPRRDLAVPVEIDSLQFRVVTNAARAPVVEGITQVGASGTFHTAIPLPDDVVSGTYRLEVVPIRGGAPVPTWAASQYFRVEEFRRPEYEVSAEVDVGPHVGAAAFEARASATYYDGASLGGGSVIWHVSTSSTRWYPGEWDRSWRFGASDWNADEEEGFFELEGRTDRSGVHAVRLTPAPPREPLPVWVSVSVQVMDANRQAGSDQTWTMVHPASVSAGIRLGRYWVRPAEDVTVDVVVVDLDGMVRPGRVPVVRVLQMPDERRPASADRPVEIASRCARGEEERTGAQDFRPLTCTFTPRVSGRYRIEAEVADGEGRRSLTRTSLQVLGPPGPWSRPTPDRMEITPDRTLYHAGETARLLVESPSYPARGLLTVERFGFREIRPIVIDGPQTEIAVPIHAEDAGGLSVRVDVSAMSATAEARSVSADLGVDIEARRLAVSLSPPPGVVAPGDDVDIRMRVTDARGDPAAGGDVALWLVDEAILRLASYRLDDPLARLHANNDRYRSGLLLPQRLVRWRRRPLGPGFVTAEVLNMETGAPETNLAVELDGTDRQARVEQGALVLRDVEPGTYRLVISREATVVLEQTISVPAEGVDLGTLLTPSARFDGALQLNEVIVTGRRAIGNSVSYLSATTVAASAPLDQPRGAEQELVDVREDFRALAAFEAHVRLDDEGMATVRVRLPDTMTRYRVFAVASHGDTRFGTAESSVTAARDLVVRASPPRTLHPGDEPEIPLLVQNASDSPAAVDVVARARGLELTGSRGYHLRLPPGAHTEVRFPAAAATPGEATVEFLAVASLNQGAAGAREPTDAVRTAVPVSVALAPRAVALHDQVSAEGTFALALETPARAQRGYGSLEVEISTTLLLPAVDALRSLCLSPELWPDATAARVLGLAGADPLLGILQASDLPRADSIRAILREDVRWLQTWLSGYDSRGAQVSAGFISPLSVLVAIHALSVADELGRPDVATPGLATRYRQQVRDIWDRQYGWLSNPHAPRSGYVVATAAYAVYVSSRLGGVVGDEWIPWVASLEPEDLPVEVMAWLLTPISEVPELAEVGASFRRVIENRALTTAGTVTFRQGERRSVEAEQLGIERLVMASSRRADAVTLIALLERAPDHPLIPGLVRGLLGHRDGTAAAGAHENAWVLLALGQYAAMHRDTESRSSVSVMLDGRLLGDAIGVDAGRPTALVSGPLPTPGAPARLAIRSEGTGTLYVRTALRYAPLVTRDTPAEERGFLVDRRYEAVDDPADVTLDADGTWRVRAGARVRVRLTLTALARRYQVELEDAIPGGFEALNPHLRGTGFTRDTELPPPGELGLGTVSAPVASTLFNAPYGWDLSEVLFRWRASSGRWATHEQLRDDEMLAYTPLMLAGTYQSTYLVRATTPGTFLAPPPRVEETENPETFGQGRPDLVVVEDRP